MTNEYDFWVVSINSPVITPLKAFTKDKNNIRRLNNGTKMIYRPYRKQIRTYLYSLPVAYVDVTEGREKLNTVMASFREKLNDSRMTVHSSYIARD